MKGLIVAWQSMQRILQMQHTLKQLVPLAILAGLLALGSTVNLCHAPNNPGAGLFQQEGHPQFAPKWTPDGNYIVFGDQSPRHLYLARIDGTKVERIAGGRGEYEIYYSPDISPDGSRIVYATARYPGERGRSLEIETADLDGSNRRDREDKRIIGKSPVWSPDGSRIAFIYPSNGHSVMAADGSEQRTVFGPEYYGQHFELGQNITGGYPKSYSPPAWSSDGTKLALAVHFSSVHNPSGDRDSWRAIYTVGADGTGLALLYASPTSWYGPRTSPAWSPDGRRLAFMLDSISTDNSGRVRNVYTIGVDGSELRKIAEVIIGSQPGGSLSWSPDGTEILFTVAATYGSLPGAVYIARADGSGLRRVGAGDYASWSPDGSRIAVIERLSNYYLSTRPPEGPDALLLVTQDQDGNFKFSNPNQRCILWICW